VDFDSEDGDSGDKLMLTPIRKNGEREPREHLDV
jgi:hypothetical protein